MISEAHFDLRRLGDLALVEVSGDLDISNAHEFESALERAAQAEGRAIIVSLDGATYFDSKGIQVILRFAERLARQARRLHIVAPSGTSPRRILEIAGIPSSIPMFDSAEDAVSRIPDG